MPEEDMKSGDELPVGVSPIPGVALMPAVAVMVAVLSDPVIVDVAAGVAVTLMAGVAVRVGVALLPAVVVGVMVRVGVALIAGVAGMVAVALVVGDDAGVSVDADMVPLNAGVAEISAVADAAGAIVASATTLAVAGDAASVRPVILPSGEELGVTLAPASATGAGCAVAGTMGDTTPVTGVSEATPVAPDVGDSVAVTVRDGVGVDVWPAAMSGVAPARSTRVAVAETGGVAVICLPPAMVAPAVAEAVIAATVALTGDAVSVAGAAVGDGSTTAVAVTAVGSVWREPAFRVADGGTAATAVFVETPVAPLAATSVALEVALIVAAGRTGALLERVGAIVGGVPSPWPRGVAVADGVSVAVAVIVGETGRGSVAQFASIPVSVLSEITL